MKTITSPSQRLGLLTYHGRKYFHPGQIVRLESDSNYTQVHFLDGKKVLVAKVLREFESILEPLGFLRTHRSHLVNLSHVVSLDDSGFVRLSDDSTAAVSRRKRKDVLKVVSLFSPAA